MPSGRVIGFATMQPDARHYIVTSNASYRVPRVSQLAASLQQNNITEELKTLTFSKKSDLPKGIEKLDLSELVYNKSPMFVCSPNSDNFKLSPILIEKFELNLDKCLKNLRFITYYNWCCVGILLLNLYRKIIQTIRN